MAATSTYLTNFETNKQNLINTVTAVLNISNQNPQGLPTVITEIVINYFKEYQSFGEAEWATLGVKVDPPPLLPENFSRFWEGPCPIFANESVKKTHLLVYLPATVNGEPLTLNKLQSIIKNYLSKPKDPYELDTSSNDLYNIPINQSRWVIMTKQVLPESKNLIFKEQQQKIEQLAKETLISYKIPTLIEAATCILTHSLISSELLFPNIPTEFTRCGDLNEQISLGSHSGNCLSLAKHQSDCKGIGVAAICSLETHQDMLTEKEAKQQQTVSAVID